MTITAREKAIELIRQANDDNIIAASAINIILVEYLTKLEVIEILEKVISRDESAKELADKALY